MESEGTTKIVYDADSAWIGVPSDDLDLLIYCSDGVMACSQVQMAAASPWMSELLLELRAHEEFSIQTLIIPFVGEKEMKQVLELMVTGEVVAVEDELANLVATSTILGCQGDMSQGPQIGPKPDQRSTQVIEEASLETTEGLIMQAQRRKSLASILDELHQIQKARLTAMDEEEKSCSTYTLIQENGRKRRRNTRLKEYQWEDSDEDRGDFEAASSPETQMDFVRGLVGLSDAPQAFINLLSELSESVLSRDGSKVMCGICDRGVRIPNGKTWKAKIAHFTQKHYSRCYKKIHNEDFENPHELKTSTESKLDTPKDANAKRKEQDVAEEDEDDLDDVYREHAEKSGKNQSRTSVGRKRGELPPIEKIRSFLAAVGGAIIINQGAKIKCGQCANKLRINPERTIMGNIRYFERTHFVRCPVRLRQEGKPVELVSESFTSGRSSPSQILMNLQNVSLFDTAKGKTVSQLVMDQSRLKGKKKTSGLLVKLRKKMTMSSKRFQALGAGLVCFSCEELFETEAEVESHHKTEHPDETSPFLCLACQVKFEKYEELQSHLEFEHNYKIAYKCSFCQRELKTQSQLSRHIASEHPEESLPYNCAMCTVAFSTFRALQAHQKRHTNIDPVMQVDSTDMMAKLEDAYVCQFCNSAIKYGKHLDIHIRSLHYQELQMGQPAYRCKLCTCDSLGFQEFYWFELHLKEHGIYIDHICRFCHLALQNRNKYIQHMKARHPNTAIYECPRYGCEKTFSRKQNLIQHLVLHKVKEGIITDDMKFACKHCKTVFYTRQLLEKHVKTDHPEKTSMSASGNATLKNKEKFRCNRCGEAFQHKSKFMTHIMKHDNNPGFVCDHCGKGFYKKDRLDIHTRSVHLDQKKFQCELCHKRFIDSYKLKRHRLTHEAGGRQSRSAPARVSKKVALPAVVTSEALDADEPQYITTVIGLDTEHQVVLAQPHVVLRKADPDVVALTSPANAETVQQIVYPNFVLPKHENGAVRMSSQANADSAQQIVLMEHVLTHQGDILEGNHHQSSLNFSTDERGTNVEEVRDTVDHQAAGGEDAEADKLPQSHSQSPIIIFNNF